MAEPVLIHVDMPQETVDFCLKTAAGALAAHPVDKDAAAVIKKALETDGNLWHVVVGASFGMSVSHANRSLLLFRIGKIHVLIFQTFDDASLVRKDTGATQVSRRVGEKKGEEDEDEA